MSDKAQYAALGAFLSGGAMLHPADTINLADHEAADALSAYEDERRKRIEAEQTAARYAQRVADAEQAMAVMIDDLMKRGQTAEAIGNIMRALRSYLAGPDAIGFQAVSDALHECDKLRKVLDNGRQA